MRENVPSTIVGRAKTVYLLSGFQHFRIQNFCDQIL